MSAEGPGAPRRRSRGSGACPGRADGVRNGVMFARTRSRRWGEGADRRLGTGRFAARPCAAGDREPVRPRTRARDDRFGAGAAGVPDRDRVPRRSTRRRGCRSRCRAGGEIAAEGGRHLGEVHDADAGEWRAATPVRLDLRISAVSMRRSPGPRLVSAAPSSARIELGLVGRHNACRSARRESRAPRSTRTASCTGDARRAFRDPGW
jgi:hypothetical protein